MQVSCAASYMHVALLHSERPKMYTTFLLHSERLKLAKIISSSPTELRKARIVLYTILAFLSAIGLKMVSLIHFMVSEIDTLTKFRSTICYTFIINCTSFEKLHGFSINMQ